MCLVGGGHVVGQSSKTRRISLKNTSSFWKEDLAKFFRRKIVHLNFQLSDSGLRNESSGNSLSFLSDCKVAQSLGRTYCRLPSCSNALLPGGQMFWNRGNRQVRCDVPVSRTPDSDAKAEAAVVLNFSLSVDVSKCWWVNRWLGVQWLGESKIFFVFQDFKSKKGFRAEFYVFEIWPCPEASLTNWAILTNLGYCFRPFTVSAHNQLTIDARIIRSSRSAIKRPLHAEPMSLWELSQYHIKKLVIRREPHGYYSPQELIPSLHVGNC